MSGAIIIFITFIASALFGDMLYIFAKYNMVHPAKRLTIGEIDYIQLFDIYAKAMSSSIISANPSIAPIVPVLVCSSSCDSGISSSITTYIIAPAAKDNA